MKIENLTPGPQGITAPGIQILKIEIKDRPVPVWNKDSVHQFAEAVKTWIADKASTGLIITSAHKEFFAGADLKSLMPFHELDRIQPMLKELLTAFRALEKDPRPVVALINGSAFGGGYELALACNHRIAIRNPQGRIGLPETSLGLLPGAGGTQRLPRLIGVAQALPLMSEGRRLTFEKALESKLIEQLAKDEAQGWQLAVAWIQKNKEVLQPWDQKGFRFPGIKPGSSDWNQWFSGANAFLQKKTMSNYPAQNALISAVYEGCALPFDSGLVVESRYFAKCLLSPEATAMTRTFFFSLNELNSGNRRPKDPAVRIPKSVGILGAGMMGRGIALVTAQSGMNVVLKDASFEFAQNGKQWVSDSLQKDVEKGRLQANKKEEILNRIQVSDDYESFADCDLIVEAVIEDRKIKKDVFAAVSAVTPPSCLLASNTSTLPITGLSEYTSAPTRFVGIHFFSPVEKMALVEIIRGKSSSEEAIAWALDYVKALKKTPIIVNDGRGFYTSRVFSSFVNEGFALLQEGVLPALIENCGRQIGMPVGPLTVADEVSLDLMYHVSKQTLEDTGHLMAKASLEVGELFVKKLDRLGKKTKRGIYEYPEQGKKYFWPGLRDLFPLAAEQPAAELVKKRLLYAQLFEGARAMEEGVLLTPEDGDVGSVFGWGFCPQTGGVFSCLDSIGLKTVVAEGEKLHRQFGERFAVPKLLRSMQDTRKTFYK